MLIGKHNQQKLYIIQDILYKTPVIQDLIRNNNNDFYRNGHTWGIVNGFVTGIIFSPDENDKLDELVGRLEEIETVASLLNDCKKYLYIDKYRNKLKCEEEARINEKKHIYKDILICLNNSKKSVNINNFIKNELKRIVDIFGEVTCSKDSMYPKYTSKLTYEPYSIYDHLITKSDSNTNCFFQGEYNNNHSKFMFSYIHAFILGYNESKLYVNSTIFYNLEPYFEKNNNAYRDALDDYKGILSFRVSLKTTQRNWDYLNYLYTPNYIYTYLFVYYCQVKKHYSNVKQIN